MYSTEDLVKGAVEIFGFGPALVRAALKNSGKTEFTLEEAKAIVDEFAGKKV